MSNAQNNPALVFRRRMRYKLISIGLISLGNLSLLCTGMLAAAGFAPATAVAQQSPTGGTPPPVAYSSVSELNAILTQVKETAAAIQSDLDRMRIEKWKTDGSTKRQMQGNVDSIRRNLKSAMPEILSQVSNSPEDLAASFKLYRNLDALYDVFGSVVESAGAFGSKDEFQSVSNDMSALENARRSLGERVQKLASAKEDELGRLRAQVKMLSAAPPAPPKKIIVDDTEPPKKPAKKKTTKPATPAKPNPTTASPSPSQ